MCIDKVPGVVSDIGHVIRTTKGVKRHHYMPIFTYTVYGVRYVRQSSFMYSSPSVFPEGKIVTIFYKSSNPEHFYVAEQRQLPLSHLFFIAIGIVFMLAAGPSELFLLIWR